MNIGNRCEQIRNILNENVFKGYEGVSVGDAIYYPLSGMDKRFYSANRISRFLHAIKWIIGIFKISVLDSYDYYHNDGSKTLFLFSSSYSKREDMKECYYNVANTIMHRSLAVCNDRHRLFLKGLLDIPTYFSWNHILKSVDIHFNKYERIYIILCMTQPYHDYRCIDRYFYKKGISFKNVVTWCDVHSVDSYFAQRFNSDNKCSITLQHGFYSERHNNWTILGAKSKIFFVENEYTRDMLKRNNYLGEIMVCGSVHNIGVEITSKDQVSYKKMGITMSGELFHDFNEEICQRVVKIEGINAFDLICKFHPASVIADYPKESIEKYKEVYGREISSSQFLETIDFALLCPSTMIYEALYHGIPFLVLKDPDGNYKDYGLSETFLVKIEDLDMERIYKLFTDEYRSEYEKIKSYYIVAGNIGEKYTKEFGKIGIS